MISAIRSTCILLVINHIGFINQVDTASTIKNSGTAGSTKHDKGKQIVMEETSDIDDNYHFTKEQYTKLFALIQSNNHFTGCSSFANIVVIGHNQFLKTGISFLPKILSAVKGVPKCCWVIDTNATDHITNNIDKFYHYKAVYDVYMQFPQKRLLVLI